MTWPNFGPQVFEGFKDIYLHGAGSSFIWVQPTEMAEIPGDWWGRYTNPSEGIEAKVYARVVIYSTHQSEDRMKVHSFDAGQAVLTHYSKPGTPYPANFEGANSLNPTVTMGTSKKRMTRVEVYTDGEAPSDVSMIPIIMVVMVMVALAFTFK